MFTLRFRRNGILTLSLAAGFVFPLKPSYLSRLEIAQNEVRQWLPNAELIPDDLVQSDAGSTLKFRVRVNGISVEGGVVLEHEFEGNPPRSFVTTNLKAFPRTVLNQTLTRAGSSGLKILPPLRKGESFRFIRVRGTIWEDALTGEKIAEIPHRRFTGVVELDGLGQFPSSREGHPILDPAQDESAARAAENSQLFLNYIFKYLSWNSFDNLGSELTSFVRAGNGFSNAYFDEEGKWIVYGAGDGVNTRDATWARDVAGHEWFHGVIQASAKLLPLKDPGAIAEAICDFFGLDIEGKRDWIFGEDLYLRDNLALRDWAQPSRISGDFLDETGEWITRPHPTTLADQWTSIDMPCSPVNDQCWIHENATILGHRLFQIAGKLNQIGNGTALVRDLLLHILLHRLTPTTTWEEFEEDLRQGCFDLYGRSHLICTSINSL